MPISVPVGTPSVSLETGTPVTLINAIAAVQANPGTAINNTNQTFAVVPTGQGGPRVLSLHARSATAVPTALAVQLYSSSDGGATWDLYQGAVTLVSGVTPVENQISNLVSGLIYQLLVSALTLGSATTVSVDGTIS